MGFVQECKNCLTFEKSLSVIYHSHRLKKKKMIILKDTKKLTNLNTFMIKISSQLEIDSFSS